MNAIILWSIIGVIIIIMILSILVIIFYHNWMVYEKDYKHAWSINDDLVAYIEDLEEHIKELKEDQDNIISNNK